MYWSSKPIAREEEERRRRERKKQQIREEEESLIFKTIMPQSLRYCNFLKFNAIVSDCGIN